MQTHNEDCVIECRYIRWSNDFAWSANVHRQESNGDKRKRDRNRQKQNTKNSRGFMCVFVRRTLYTHTHTKHRKQTKNNIRFRCVRIIQKEMK